MTGTGVMHLKPRQLRSRREACKDSPSQPQREPALTGPPRRPQAIPLPLESQLGQDHSGRPAPWGGVRWGSESGLLWGLRERDGAGAACSLQQHLLKHCALCPQVLTQQPNQQSDVSGRDLRVGRHGGHWPG